MPVICSPIKEIDNLYIEKWQSGKVYKGCDVLVANEGRTVIIRSKNGALRCNQLKNYAYAVSKWPWNDSVMRGLVKLGAITQSACDEHLRRAKEISEKREGIWHAEAFQKYADSLGIELTDEQRKQVDAAINVFQPKEGA